MSKIVAKLVKRLRSSDCCDAPMCNCDEAADGIEHLKEEVERLRAALEKIGGIKGPYSAQWPESQEGYASFAVVTSRDALTQEKTDG
jgi:hypothetical protein